MAYTCHVKGLEEVEKLDRKWIYVALLTEIVRDVKF